MIFECLRELVGPTGLQACKQLRGGVPVQAAKVLLDLCLACSDAGGVVFPKAPFEDRQKVDCMVVRISDFPFELSLGQLSNRRREPVAARSLAPDVLFDVVEAPVSRLLPWVELLPSVGVPVLDDMSLLLWPIPRPRLQTFFVVVIGGVAGKGLVL
jgi:hypothetical protein